MEWRVFVATLSFERENRKGVTHLDRLVLDTTVRQRQREILAAARMDAAGRRSLRRVPARVRFARALRAVGYALLDAGHSLEPESWRSA